MNKDIILLRLGELTLKGRNRHRFETQVQQQLKRVLQPFPSVTIRHEYGRVYLDLGGSEYAAVARQLDKVFGLHSYSPAIRCGLRLEEIQTSVREAFAEIQVKPRTFKISARRVNKKFPYDTYELNRLLGGTLLEQHEDLQVDVHNPELDIRVEIREQEALVFSEVVPGPGGFPLGSNGKAMLMLSGGIDSPVAGWLAMRKGLRVQAVHFHSFPYTSERAKLKVIDLTRTLAGYAGKITLHMVPFTDIQTRLKQECRDNLLITMMRRAMFRITEQLAARQEALAIVTGESLGQVASQTLPSMHVIGAAATLPLIRPLITLDKAEITAMAERIGTYPISILPYEDCCTLFVPKSPSTNPNIHAVERQERYMEEWLPEAIRTAVEQTETMYIVPEQPEKEDSLF
ncbi:tRNA uracil 4-sulfurtransferase ThiI [Paenibacillus sp. HJGM_3]|uniref:tRNA uracil 4-sulfurtransferase ThiI n=1 Tax=Paenibacillus sp. HJGM_3 TaxID=3379816 RepID=UPI003859019C